MFAIFSALGSFLGGPITAITGQIAGYFTNAKTVEATEFAAMTSAEQAEVVAYMQSVNALNQAKVQNNASGISHFLILAFGLPPAIYLGAIYIGAAIPALGWRSDPLRGSEGVVLLDIAKTIALSFFLYGGAVTLGGPLLSSLASRIRGQA